MLRSDARGRARSVARAALGPVGLPAIGLASCVILVAMLGGAVGANDPIGMDIAVDRLVPHPAVGESSRGGSLIRDIGGEKGAFTIAAAAGLVLWLRGRDWISGIALVAAYTGASATTFILKEAIGRRGPAAFDPTSQGLSFPSAHAARVTAVLGLLVVLLALFRSRRVALIVATAGSVALIAMMVSQLSERRHWLTDQLGGIAVGAGWVFVLAPVALHVAATGASLVPDELVVVPDAAPRRGRTRT